mmetsp:Transcript_86385/g.152899  ORF Transcript_86385/g.152899 Transcript_86385/m.152899 type:complete len:118 (-) Transcript_86385:224-577(-)
MQSYKQIQETLLKICACGQSSPVVHADMCEDSPSKTYSVPHAPSKAYVEDYTSSPVAPEPEFRSISKQSMKSRSSSTSRIQESLPNVPEATVLRVSTEMSNSRWSPKSKSQGRDTFV